MGTSMVGTAFMVLAAMMALPPPERAEPPLAPPFPAPGSAVWLGTPVSWPDLAGQVVLLDVWTFDCVNCVRTIPWIKEMKVRYAGKGLAMVGIHTPELEHERQPAAVRNAVERFGLDYPHLLDNDYAYWRALGNQYWPTIYLVDRCGRIRVRQIGEVHLGKKSGSTLEGQLQTLLDEPSECRPTGRNTTPPKTR